MELTKLGEKLMGKGRVNLIQHHTGVSLDFYAFGYAKANTIARDWKEIEILVNLGILVFK